MFQGGFRAGLSTVDQIFALDLIARKYIARKKKLYAFFVDFKAAFDTVNRNSLIYKLSLKGVSTKFLSVYRELIAKTSASVWNGSDMSNAFVTEKGVPQGCVLSPILFALFIDDVPENLPGGVAVGDIFVKILLYADDLVVLTDSPQTLQLQINKLKQYCETWDLEINIVKSKVMIFQHTASRRLTTEKWKLSGETIEVVSEFKYLGFLLTYNLNLRPHVEQKVINAKTAINLMWPRFYCNKNVDNASKFKVFNATINACLCYANQVFGFKKVEEFERLQCFLFKRIFKLPTTIPTYAIYVETGITQIFLKNLKANADFIVKIMKRSNTNLQNQLIRYAFRCKLSPFKDWLDLAEEHGVELHLTLENLEDWRIKFYDCIAQVDQRFYESCLNRARLSESRYLYRTLNHSLGSNNYFSDSLTNNEISTIFKMRTETLYLNFMPHRQDLRISCSLCNLNVPEGIFHFLAECPILLELRRLYFSQSFLTLQEASDCLNGTRGWKILSQYCIHAYKYRNSFLE